MSLINIITNHLEGGFGFPIYVTRGDGGKWDMDRMVWNPMQMPVLRIVGFHEWHADWYWQEDEHGRRELCDDRRLTDWIPKGGSYP